MDIIEYYPDLNEEQKHAINMIKIATPDQLVATICIIYAEVIKLTKDVRQLKEKINEQAPS